MHESVRCEIRYLLREERSLCLLPDTLNVEVVEVRLGIYFIVD